MTKLYTIIRRFLFRLVGISLNRNYLSGSNKFIIWFAFRLYLNILKTEKTLQFSEKKFSTCVAKQKQVLMTDKITTQHTFNLTVTRQLARSCKNQTCRQFSRESKSSLSELKSYKLVMFDWIEAPRKKRPLRRGKKLISHPVP